MLFSGRYNSNLGSSVTPLHHHHHHHHHRPAPPDSNPSGDNVPAPSSVRCEVEGDCLLSSCSKVDNEEGGLNLKQQHTGQVSGLSGVVSPWAADGFTLIKVEETSWLLNINHQSPAWPGLNKRNLYSKSQFCDGENVLDYTNNIVILCIYIVRSSSSTISPRTCFS